MILKRVSGIYRKFGGRKGNGEITLLYYNLKNKRKQFERNYKKLTVLKTYILIDLLA